LVRDARRKFRLAEPRAGRLEAEAVPVEVVARGDGKADLDRAVDRLGRKTECFLRLEQVIGGAEVERADRRLAHKQQEEKQLFHLVSAATQSRYAVKPRSIGTAMISGSSYGCAARNVASSSA